VLYQTDDYITPKGVHIPTWMCECQCEQRTKRIINGYSLKRGDSKSCGCYKIEAIKKSNGRQNIYELINNEYYIGYTQSNDKFYFDKEDYTLVSKYCWSIDNQNGYVKTIDKVNNTGKLYLHRLVMNCSKGDNTIVDHIDRNRVNCRKNNLRIVTRCQNNMNMSIRCDNTTGVTGVHWDKKMKQWCSLISANKTKIHLGYFDNFEDAVKARKEAEEKYFGEYNRTNY
jgi:hypothetical protein